MASSKTLVMVAWSDVPSFANKPILPGVANNPLSQNVRHVLNANLADFDGYGVPSPFLAEMLPELNSESWRVFPDGRMETTYRLHPNLTWHDGQLLTAADFAFAWRVYATSAFGVATSGAMGYIQEVVASDPRLVVIRWSRPYAEAGGLSSDFPPLPRHLLEQSLDQLSPEAFASLPYWRSDYISAGPWKLERVEPGAFFEASAFDGFLFGRPKIDRVRVIYVPDSNAIVATLLSGEAHYSVENVLYGEDGLTLERAWGGAGNVLWEATSTRSFAFQYRPEFAVPQQLATDVRVRKAITQAMDKQSLWSIVEAGHGYLRDIYSHPNADYYDAVARAMPTRYPHDVRAAQRYLEEAGFRRSGDGQWTTPNGERFRLEHWYRAGGSNERESTLLVDQLRTFGIDATSNVWGNQRSSLEEQAKIPGMLGQATGLPDKFHSADVPKAENRWTGTNTLGYANPELDRFIDAYQTALDRPSRVQQIIEMERIAADDLPGVPLYWRAKVIGHSSTLKGVPQNMTVEGINGARKIWTWEWQA